MSLDTTAIPAGQRVAAGRSQASLRDHLNERIAPYLKKAMIEGLNNDVEFPLQWLGEELIHLSMLHEGNPDATNIKSHFKYNHDAPAPIETEEPSLQPGQQQQQQQQQIDASMANVARVEPTEPAYVNGMASASAHDTQAPSAADTNTLETLPVTSQTAAEDTEMQGTT